MESLGISEELDNQANVVGTALGDLSYAVDDLYDKINYGPELGSVEARSALYTLDQVRALLKIAWELYPYSD